MKKTAKKRARRASVTNLAAFLVGRRVRATYVGKARKHIDLQLIPDGTTRGELPAGGPDRAAPGAYTQPAFA